MARKNFFEKAINRKIGGMKRSAKANLKRESESTKSNEIYLLKKPN